MKAIVVTEPGGIDRLAIREQPDLVPSEGQVRIAVRATALNRADLLQRRGKYPPPPGESELLGLECAGVVDATGPGVGSLKVGDRVMALLPGGGYAEQVVVHERMAIPVPESLDFTQAAAIPEAFLTAREALFGLGGLQPDQSVLVHAGASGVGSAAIQLAHLHGATVFTTAGSPEKLRAAQALGAAVAINYRTEDFAAVVDERTRKAGVHVVLDFIGGAYWEQHARCMAIGGRCVVIGVLGGAKAEVNLGKLLMKRHQILGLVMRSRPLVEKVAMTQRFIRESLPHFERGALRPVIDSVFAFEDVARAHERMEQNANTGKIVLSLNA